MTHYEIENLVIGAGVVGLACARQIALSGQECLVLEAKECFGAGVSSRNSEVIHAGMYYPTGSLKAKLCVRGRHLLYEYCKTKSIKHRKIGKIIVATSDLQLSRLAIIKKQAKLNKVDGVSYLSSKEVSTLEPEVVCLGALYSEETGILDSHSFMTSLLADYESLGGLMAYRCPVIELKISNGGITATAGIEEVTTIKARKIINASGHSAPKILMQSPGFSKDLIPNQWYAKGNYFSLSGRQPFNHLIYPIPEDAGLGVHATIDLNGRCRFGPDVQWVENEFDFHVDRERLDIFFDAISQYWPGIARNKLMPDYAGIRPKIHGPGSQMPDFLIQSSKDHGIDGLINLLGIESPGLTASLAIAEYVNAL